MLLLQCTIIHCSRQRREDLTVSSFLKAGSSIQRQNAKLLDMLGDLKSLGQQWAARASREVLQDIDRPCINSIRASEILALYWLAVGESLRNNMFSG